MTLGHPTTPPPPTPPSGPASAPSRSLDLDRPLVAAAVALLATALVLSTVYSRRDGDLDWSNYLVGLAATLGLLVMATAVFVHARAADPATDMVAWPGAFGAVGVGLMIAVAMDDSDATAYVAGISVVVLSVAGVLLTRRGPFVVTGVLGLYVTYLQLMDDVLGVADDDEVGAISIAVALALFAVLVTVAGWVRPESRVLAGAVAGALTVVGFATLTGTLALAQVFQSAFGLMSPDVVAAPGGDATYEGSYGMDQATLGESVRFDGYDNDTWVILGLSLLLVVGWAACAALTRHVVFRILMVAMAVSVTPLATAVLSVEHPSWWGVVLGGAGGGLLVVAALRARAMARSGLLDAN